MPTTLADIRARVQRVYRRKDHTESDLDEWINDAARRILSTLTTPFNEAIAEAIVPQNFTGGVNIPNNLLNLLSIQVDGVELEMRAITEVRAAQKQPAGQASYYAREAGEYIIAPMPKPGSKVRIHFRADENKVLGPTDTLKLFDVMPDLVQYGTLIRGADWSVDDRNLAKWTSMYNSRFIELQDMADRDELLNASMAFAYDSNGDWY